MSFWDERYGQEGFAYGTDPNEFLVAQVRRIPHGRVLCLAEGEGRNAVFLAKLGYEVHAVDLSRVGLQKAQALAARHGVSITTEVADLGVLELRHGYWQGIVSIFAHMPPAARKALHARVVGALSPGGAFVLEAYTPRQREIGGIGGPSEQQADLFMSLASLQTELAGLEFEHAQELDRDVNEGRFHRGRGAVVQVVGRKAA